MDTPFADRPLPGVQVSAADWCQWPDLRESWAELAAGIEAPSFFLNTDWIEAWLSVFGEALQPQFLVFRADTTVVGACILVRRRHRYGPVAVRRIYLNTAGEDPADSPCVEYNDLPCRPGFEAQVASALWAHLRNMRWDELVLAGFQEGPGCSALRTAFGEMSWVANERPSLYVDLDRLREREQTYELVLSKNTRYQIRRSSELYRERGAIAVESAADTDGALRMLDELAELHQESWQKRGQPGVFSSTKFRAFHRALIRNAFPHGGILLTRVLAGDQTIGVLYSLHHAGRVCFYQSGLRYVDDSRYQPGMVTLFYSIQDCLDRGYKEFDFLAGDMLYKRRLATDARPLHWIVVERNTLATRAVHSLRKIKHQFMELRGTGRPTGSAGCGAAP
jgi:CelD/BcsL family acetyltransferase involved in cellulose biosynthesis